MKPAMYERKGANIKGLETNETIPYKSINEAKRESRRLQMKEDGALGRGSVRKIK